MTTLSEKYAMYGGQLRAISQTCNDKKVVVTEAQREALKNASSIVQGLAYQMRYYPESATLHPTHETPVVAIIVEMTEALTPHAQYLDDLTKTITPLMGVSVPYTF